MQKITKYATIQNIANALARESGCGKCDEIQFTHSEKAKVFHAKYGYRKMSTGEYVPMAYLKNFGWRNTYYQNAETTVFIPIHILELWASENLKKKRGW